MNVIEFPRQYGLQYPIHKTPGPWLVVGLTVAADRSHVHSVDIHLDADDPVFKFEQAEDWPELPAAVIRAYNAPHRRTHRLALRRAVDMAPHDNVFPPARVAERRMAIVMARRSAPGSNVCLPWAGGYVCGEDSGACNGNSDDQAAFMAAIDLWRARTERRFGHADVNRRAIESFGFAIAVHGDGGVEYWRVR